MGTIVKTGCVLSVDGDPNEIEHIFLERRPQLYGDMHIVGNCAIIYYPRFQAEVGDKMSSNGIITFPTGVSVFQRNGEKQCILVIQAKYIKMERSKIHPLDAAKLQAAGGVVEGPPYREK